MKKTIKPFNILLPLFLLLQLNLFAQDDKGDKGGKGDKGEKNEKKYDFTKTKSVNKSYNVSSNDKLSIDNEFGKVEVHTWDKNEIKVDVSIEVSANKEELAQRVIDGITVSDAQKGRDISFKTTIKSSNNSSHDEKSTMHVNYSISMPASNPLNVSNQFGATTIPDYRGEVELNSKFGSLTAGALSNIKTINVEFGKANFQSIANGTVTVKYSKAEFSKLVGNIKLNLEFCGVTKVNMDNTLTGLDVKSSYSSVNLKPTADLSAAYTISTSFGSLKNNTSVKFDGDDNGDDSKGPKFDHKYNGKSGSGNIQIKVSTNFGKIILGEPGPDDMKDKEKSKSRSRTS